MDMGTAPGPTRPCHRRSDPNEIEHFDCLRGNRHVSVLFTIQCNVEITPTVVHSIDKDKSCQPGITNSGLGPPGPCHRQTRRMKIEYFDCLRRDQHVRVLLIVQCNMETTATVVHSIGGNIQATHQARKLVDVGSTTPRVDHISLGMVIEPVIEHLCVLHVWGKIGKTVYI